MSASARRARSESVGSYPGNNIPLRSNCARSRARSGPSPRTTVLTVPCSASGATVFRKRSIRDPKRAPAYRILTRSPGTWAGSDIKRRNHPSFKRSGTTSASIPKWSRKNLAWLSFIVVITAECRSSVEKTCAYRPTFPRQNRGLERASSVWGMPGTSRCRYILSCRATSMRAKNGTQTPVDRRTTGLVCLSGRRATRARTKTLSASPRTVETVSYRFGFGRSKERIERPVRAAPGPVMRVPFGATRRTSKPAWDRSDARVFILAASAYRARLPSGTPDITTMRGNAEAGVTIDADSTLMLGQSANPIDALKFVGVDHVVRRGQRLIKDGLPHSASLNRDARVIEPKDLHGCRGIRSALEQHESMLSPVIGILQSR